MPRTAAATALVVAALLSGGTAARAGEWKDLQREKAKVEAHAARIEAFLSTLTLPRDAEAGAKARMALDKDREALRILDGRMRSLGRLCASYRASRDRLASGLPVQQEAIRRTEALLRGAREDVEAAGAEAAQALLGAALQEAKGYAQSVLASTEALRAQVELLGGLDKGKRDALIRSLHTVAFAGEDLGSAAAAGYGNATELMGKTDRLASLVDQTHKLLVDSGIAEQVGEKLAEGTWGPAGGLAFRGAKLSIDLAAAYGKGKIGESGMRKAQESLGVMRAQNERVRGRIAELDRELAGTCEDVPPPAAGAP